MQIGHLTARARWLVVALLLGTACDRDRAVVAVEPTVVTVVDGDTLDVQMGDGSIERIRLIGIDTPESAIPGREPDCYGPESARRLGQLAPAGYPVRLERDVEARDPYGRLLAYVYVGDLFVNLALAQEGYARVLSIPPNTAWATALSAAVARARGERSGLWARCSH